MYLFKRTDELQTYLDSVRSGNRSFGFVPTMGALHEGHLALVRRAKMENQVTISSIFVNPTQFDEAADLEKYPRTPAKDVEMLYRVGNEVLFMPEVKEIYPEGEKMDATFDFGGLDHTMEGRFRPGHFQGVAEVVSRLLRIVRPHRLYLGQKDFQQYVIVREMVRQLKLEVEVVRCPIVREKNGLAMSSRNVRLTPAERERAGLLYRTLQEARALSVDHSPGEVKTRALQTLRQPGIEPEYFEIVDARTLQPVSRFDQAETVVACTAVRVGDVRLIDNLLLRGEWT